MRSPCARARVARRVRRRAGPPARAARRHLAQRRPGPGPPGQVSALVERIVARPAALTLGASEDLVARADALGARQARLGAVAAPAPGCTQRTRPRSGRVPPRPRRAAIVSVGRLHPQKRYDVLLDGRRWRARSRPGEVVAGSGPSSCGWPGGSRSCGRRLPAGHRTDARPARRRRPGRGDNVWEPAAVRPGGVARRCPADRHRGRWAARAGRRRRALIPPGDVDALDKAVRDMLADPVKRADYAARGPRQAATWPSEKNTR